MSRLKIEAQGRLTQKGHSGGNKASAHGERRKCAHEVTHLPHRLIAEAARQEVLCTTPYHYQLYPTELVWSDIKEFVTQENRTSRMQLSKDLAWKGTNQVGGDCRYLEGWSVALCSQTVPWCRPFLQALGGTASWSAEAPHYRVRFHVVPLGTALLFRCCGSIGALCFSYRDCKHAHANGSAFCSFEKWRLRRPRSGVSLPMCTCARIISMLHASRGRHRTRIQGQGELKEVALRVPRLHPGSVPLVFPGCLSYLSVQDQGTRETPTPTGADKKPSNSPVTWNSHWRHKKRSRKETVFRPLKY